MKNAYNQGLECDHQEENGDDSISPKDVGHNIYILAHQVCLLLSIIEVLKVWENGLKLYLRPLCIKNANFLCNIYRVRLLSGISLSRVFLEVGIQVCGLKYCVCGSGQSITTQRGAGTAYST